MENRPSPELWPSLNLDVIRNSQKEFYERHKVLLPTFNSIIDEFLTLFLEMSKIALNCNKEKIDQDFMYAYTTIGTRWFSHFESMTQLLFSGYYGDAIALARIIHGDINLLLYFGHFPNDVIKWRKLSDYWPQKKDEPKEIKEIRQYFRDSEVRKRLSEKQLPFDDKGILSEAVHATDWGTQYYALKQYDKEHSSVINFGPIYDPIFALKVRCLMVTFVRPPCDAFMNHCHQTELNVLGMEEVVLKYFALVKEWDKQVDKFSYVIDNILKIEKRIDKGENLHDIAEEESRKLKRVG